MRASVSEPALRNGGSQELSKGSTHPFVRSKCKVGSASFDKSNFKLGQKIFHQGDVPDDVREARKVAVHSKKPNILGVERKAWNHSVIADQKIQKDSPEAKKRMLHIRAGLLDEKSLKQGKMHSDEAIMERRKFVVANSGRGPVGPCGKWFNAVDERGLAKHCIRDDWPDWNESHSCHAKDDMKQAVQNFDEKENRRRHMHAADSGGKLNKDAYVHPTDAQSNITHHLRESKIHYQELKEEFKRALKSEFPDASEERLQAMAQRLLGEKLLADEKVSRFPFGNETFKPNVMVTSQDRRYRVYKHPGAWAWAASEQRYCWSCCLNFTEASRGCEYGIIDPDAWCLQGFERQPGIVNAGKA
jgi:hypothetical protein